MKKNPGCRHYDRDLIMICIWQTWSVCGTYMCRKENCVYIFLKYTTLQLPVGNFVLIVVQWILCYMDKDRPRGRDAIRNHIPESVWSWTYCSLEPGFHCDSKTRQTGVNHDYDITFIISLRMLNVRQEPFLGILQLLRLVVSLSNVGNCRPTMSIKGHGTRDLLPRITNICMFKCATAILLQWSMFTINLWYSLKVIIVVPEIGDVVRRHALA